jgi:DNA-binding NarL/FixJ family response regulator
MDGVEATRILVRDASDPVTRVLILTTFEGDEYAVDALRAGASGFLLKDVTPEGLIAAIKTVAAGDALIAPSVTRRLLDRFVAAAPHPRDATLERRIGELTPREVEVLRLVASGSSNRAIAGRLRLAEPTVKTHVSHLLDKLSLRDRAQLVVLAYEVGLVRPGDHPDLDREPLLPDG